MNLTPLNPYHIIQVLNDEVRALLEGNAEILEAVKSTEIVEVTNKHVVINAIVPYKDTEQAVTIEIKVENKPNQEVMEQIAERLKALKDIALENIDESMD